MYRYFIALALTGALAACDTGNPLVSSSTTTCVGCGSQPLIDDETTTTTDASTSTDEKYASDFDSTDLRVNAVTYDSTTDELKINNLPYDGDDNLYTSDAATTSALVTATGTSFGAYTNANAAAADNNMYYAVFRRSSSGYSQVSAVATDRYVSFGYGGAAAQRLSGTGSLPTTPESFVFNGEYAAVRTVIDTTGTTDDTRVQYVTGTIRVDVDIQDFDASATDQTGGAVEAVIVNREFFDANGVAIDTNSDGTADLTGVDYIALDTADINYDTWEINSSSATVTSNVGSTASSTGNWEGLFTGPNGEEVAGIVVVEGTGPIGIDATTGDYIEVEVRETGGFVAAR